MRKLETFTHGDKALRTEFIETTNVAPGVVCDVYYHPETQERDLGIIYIEAGKKTPLQKVLSGDETIEGYISGKGKLLILKPSGEKLEFEVGPDNEGFSHTIEVGDIMQWQAIENLVVFEICFPPYWEGRFKNLDENEVDF